MKGYWFNEGYVRTTSSEYTLKQNFGSVHLTNDAVQKHLPDYGKYEKGNKISYDELNDYLVKNNYKLNFWNDAFPKMKVQYL
jgi:tubulin monoglycylase TTLL3/8